MESPTQSISSALDRLWAQFRPQIGERVAMLKQASDALAAQSLAADLRTKARAAAHTLAGTLGTFGLAKGTMLAREAEALLSGDSPFDSATCARLSVLVQQIDAVVDSRNDHRSSD